ncbi:CDP-glucose 4,6-dehydratase [Bacillus cereus group sp. TH43LC]|uniref:CDP-glucose 4,6-dehydratase n=1 Tax=Bacillus cereus group TaxID=86661 RepID=UPI00065BF800|nr:MULTISPECIES: CDP-glucose 4,6-dehydratase [unclassified Bacillus cereus group]KMQ09082.1 CDP-glucose 4,6-dehydratase [Bacillus cereus]MBR9746233.1 CDP-glucose 4,6-dehydratase [Bacillus cereus]MDA1500370.1 CDP-glucose 4,6-dehydratase [Bacillus cereus group sp. TH43LC]MDA1789423.1 CDP-glucose 4,6-dehydratase [Bacillus cereus group sp. BY5-1LC]MDA1880159.1 CDP-glucose 4,6-dehydratase [Bacillus cereus group sp. BY10-2LC]
MASSSFWNKKKVFITGHTGFKGSWLTLFLTSLGAEVVGFSSHPPSIPNLFEQGNVAKECITIHGNITDYDSLFHALKQHNPDILFHLAAQPIVTNSYKNPIETFKTNVLGTVHVLEAAKHIDSIRGIINVTSDKCYENDGSGNQAFVESDRLGGFDPYSASKACAELVATSYQKSFFRTNTQKLASVRAGNVIGGGDWAEDRLFPDVIRAYLQDGTLTIRNKNAIRPWQHVLDPLHGYILLAEKLWTDAAYAEAWNFGPINEPNRTVHDVIQSIIKLWNKQLTIISPSTNTPYESPVLTLDSTKAVNKLGWTPKLSTDHSIAWTVDWYKKYASGENIESFTRQQIDAFKNL